MIKRGLFLLLSVWYTGIVAQEARPVTISGRIHSDKDSVRLIIWFARDPIAGYGSEMKKIQATVDARHRFSFTTPAFVKPARLSIHDAVSGTALFTREQQPIFPGDEVELVANIEADNFKAEFSGQGATKYECIQELKKTGTHTLDTARNINHILYLYDSLVNARQKLVEKFKGRMTNEEYRLIKADMIGELNKQALTTVCGYNPGSFHSTKPSPDVMAQKKKAFEKLVAHLTTSNDTEIIPQSVTYRQFLYQQSKAELVFANNGEPVQMVQLFRKLSDQYTGLLREKLLGSLLLNTTENYYFFGGIDPDEHKACLKEAMLLIHSADLKTRIDHSLKGLVKGAPAFNFTLPVDSSRTKTTSLNDLKGKVVLLDLWSYQCTGCVLFTNTFHKKIYPEFKDNPDFAVVSVMLGETGKDLYMRRLRREGGVAYTFPEYINLFGGRGIQSARDMESYHDISAFPTILLVDKYGKVYSSTLPVIYGDPRNKELEKNRDKLIAWIKKALSEPYPQ